MKILQLGKFFPIKGGVEKVMLDMSKSLSENGIHCDMLCASLDKRDFFEEIIINKNSKIIVCPTIATFYKTKISYKLVGKLKKIAADYDIIHIHHPDPFATLALLLSNFDGKVVLHWHSDIINQKKLLLVYKPLQTWLLNKANLILTTSDLYAKHSSFLQDFLYKTSTLPIGIEDKSNAIDADLVAQIKNTYQGKTIVYTLGRIVYYKGLEYFVEAATLLSDQFVCLIAGNGPLKDFLKQKIIDLKLQKKVMLLGELTDEEANAYYAACDVFCLSSTVKSEAFAIVQLEAMSFGKPVISTNIFGSGVPWVNKNEVSGEVVEVENPKQIAASIIKITESQERYKLYSKNARKRYNEKFTIVKMRDQLIKFYQNLLSS